jgi:hypothetical protein
MFSFCPRASTFAALLAASATLLSSTAYASPVEYFSGLSLHPSDPKKVVLGFESGLAGLLVSSDGGKTFRMRNSQSVRKDGSAIFPRERFPLLYTASALLVGGEDGLLAGDLESCGLTQASVTPDNFANALALHPRDPDVAFIATGKGTLGQPGLFRRAKSGDITQLGQSDTTPVLVRKMFAVTHAAGMEQLRIVQFVSPFSAGPDAVRYSDDLGVSWTEHPIGMASDAELSAFGVDPLDPNVFIVGLNKTANDGTDPVDEVLLSKDAGKTFAPYISGVVNAGEVAFAPDGRVWLGDRAGGLWQATRLGQPATKVASIAPSFLAWDTSANALLVAQKYELGRFDPKDSKYALMFRIHEVSAFVSCAGEMLRQDAQTTEQMCMHFCNGTHYWYGQFCSMYNDVRAICGLGTLQTQFAEQLPAADGSPRLPGFEATFPLPGQDGGVGPGDAGTSDAGVSVDAGNMPIDAGSHDAASPVERDADDEGEEDAAPPKHKKKGCSLSAEGGAESAGFGATLLAGLALSLRRRRARR